MRRAALFGVTAVLAVATASSGARELSIRAGAPLHVAPNSATFPEGCQLQPAPWGGVLRCPTEDPIRVWLEREGYEPLKVKAEPGIAEVVLEEAAWTPRPVTLLFQPPELAEGAAVLWKAEGRMLRAELAEGRAAGPRVRQGEKVLLLVLGPRCRSETFEVGPEARGKELTRQLQPGVSWAMECVAPWCEVPVEGCQILVGKVVAFLKRSKRPWSLGPVGKAQDFQGLAVVDLDRLPKEKLWLLVNAPGFGPGLSPWSYQAPLQSWPLPEPGELVVRVEDAEEKPLQALLVVAQESDGFFLALAEQQTDGRGEAIFTLPRGNYQLFAEAPGGVPLQEKVVLREPQETLTLTLTSAPTVPGRVLDPQGNPVPSAGILVLSGTGTGAHLVGTAQTDTMGRFLVTLGGQGPWTLRGEAPRFAPEAVTVTPEDSEVTVVLSPVCSVLLLLLGPGGALLEELDVVALRPEAFEARGVKKEGAGRYRFDLSPGSWVLLAEESRLNGNLTVGPGCQALEQVVTVHPSPPLP